MAKLSTEEINQIIADEERTAIGFLGEGSELAKNRKTLIDYYNGLPYGDEIEGQSKVVTSDVADVVEGMKPSLIKIFTQGKNIAVFESDRKEHDEEADQKTILANHVFMRQNNGYQILYDMIHDGLLSYTGCCMVYWDDSVKKTQLKLYGLSEAEMMAVRSKEGFEIIEEDDGYITVEYISSKGQVKVETFPPEELMLNRDARDFRTARFIGRRSPKTRSDLIEMGFKKDVVNDLPADKNIDSTSTKIARNHNLQEAVKSNPTTHRPNDIIFLGEYYVQLDIDGDGVTELVQVFRAGEEILDYNVMDYNPIVVAVPIRLPHRAIGTCPAEQVADIQYVKSTLARQAQNNIYQSNFSRLVYNNNVDLDDLLTPRAGGVIGVNTDGVVSGSIEPIVVQPMVGDILGAIEYWDTAREVRTGLTRYNQGMDAESLNKTATGFLGLKDMSQQRIELIARSYAEGAFQEIFEKIVILLSKYQDTAMQVKVSGEELEIDPTQWQAEIGCRVDVGLGAGDRQEKIANLNAILQNQLLMIGQGFAVVDQVKIYNTLEKLITEIGLKNVETYYNNPEKPQEILQAQNEQLLQAVTQMQAQLQNPLAEAEQVKANAKLAEAQARFDKEIAIKQAEMKQQNDQFKAEMIAKITELELKYQRNVPGSAV